MELRRVAASIGVHMEKEYIWSYIVGVAMYLGFRTLEAEALGFCIPPRAFVLSVQPQGQVHQTS